MSKQFKGILFLGIFLIAQVCFACSCERRYFCEFVKYEEYDYKMVSVRAKVLDKIVYPDSTNAAYFEVLETYRDDINIGNFIKLYGYYDDSGCRVNMNQFTPMSEVILIIGVSDSFNGAVNEMGFPFENPITDFGNYWEFAPITCQFLVLKIENDVVKGMITKEIFEYPWAIFNDR